MSGPQHADQALNALRQSGDWRMDPVQFRVLEAMARRLPAQPGPVRQLLERKLQAGLAALERNIAQRRQSAGEEAAAVLAAHPALAPQVRRLQGTCDIAALRRLADAAADAAPSPLARLNRELRSARPDDEPAQRELTSARRLQIDGRM